MILGDDNNMIIRIIWTNMVLLEYINVLQLNQRGGSRPGRSANVEREFIVRHTRIMRDYFWPLHQLRNDHSLLRGPVYNEQTFERRFTVSKRILDNLFSRTILKSPFLRCGLQLDCTGKQCISPLQNVVLAMRQLCYWMPASTTDENVRIAESTGLESMK